MVRSRWSARAALISSASVSGVQRAVSPETSRPRIASAPGEPPGSRVVTATCPRARKASARRWTWVDLPAPSPPSKTMKRAGPAVAIMPPRSLRLRLRGLAEHHAVEVDHDAAADADLRHVLCRHQGVGEFRHVRHRHDQLADFLAGGERR